MFGSTHDDSRDHDRERDSESDYSYGSGSDRDDSPFASARAESFMPMTRRDVDHLYNHALRDTSTFLKERDKHVKSRTTTEQALSIGEMLGGAVLGGYLSQRFRASGGVLPMGLLLGGIGFAAAQFTQMFGRYGEDVKNLSIGSALASGVIWAAGYGALGAEKAASKTEGNFPATGAAPHHHAQAIQAPHPPPQHGALPQTPHYVSPQHALPWPAPAYAPAFGGHAQATPSIADFQNLAAQLGL